MVRTRMHEYRLATLPALLKKELQNINLDVVEEKFKQRKSFLVYTQEPIADLLSNHGVDYTVKDVEECGWDTLWKDYLQEGWLTDTAYYCFDDKNFEDDRTVIRINPALAFGTGTHPTTQAAARLLEPVAKNATVLDIGTGSGILAILASLKGAKQVTACDIDPIALKNAKENIDLNKCNNIDVWAGDINSISPVYRPTVVVANIISSVLSPMHPHILTLRPKYIVYSGVLKKEGPDFLASLKSPGYEPEAILHLDKWSGVRFKMTSSG